MISEMLDILGRGYTPITYEYTETIYDAVSDTMTTITNYIIPSGAAGVDWEFIVVAFIFAIALYSIFRLIGGLFR